MGILESMGAVIIGAVLVLTVMAIFRIQIKMVFKLIINTIIGIIALYLINIVGGAIGITIAVNWINALITGVFGVCGVAFILMMQWLTGL